MEVVYSGREGGIWIILQEEEKFSLREMCGGKESHCGVRRVDELGNV